MGNPVQATPAMVEKLGTLPEFELTEEGVQPLSSQNQAEPSQQASQAGAAAEPAGAAPEPQPSQVAPTGAPPSLAAQQVVEPSPPPVVEVVSGQEPQAAAPQPAPAPVQAEPAATSEEEAAALERLNTFLQQQREEMAEEVRRGVQSQVDRHSAHVARQLQDSQTRAQEMTKQVRELQTRDLTEAERAKALEAFAQQDERTELDAYRVELVDFQKSVFVDSLLLEYHQYGVERGAIEAVETPEEMELYCEQQKSGFLEKKLQTNATQPVQQPAVAPEAQRPPEVPAQPVAQPVAAPVQPNAPGVPAGAQAPSDVGSGGAPAEGHKFSEEASPAALKENLKHLDWNAVRVRQA